MSNVSITKYYQLLADDVGRDTAENLISLIEEKVKKEMDNRSVNFATKEDLANTKAELIKWMFLFWIAQAGTTFGFILLFMKK